MQAKRSLPPAWYDAVQGTEQKSRNWTMKVVKIAKKKWGSISLVSYLTLVDRIISGINMQMLLQHVTTLSALPLPSGVWWVESDHQGDSAHLGQAAGLYKLVASASL